MKLHRHVLKTVNKTVLPQVMRVHEMGVPYPAELWIDGKREHENGVATFDIGEQGFLAAEYFAYDGLGTPIWGIGPQQSPTKLVLTSTGVELPIWTLSDGHKARTGHGFWMPAVQTYQCEFQGWVGGSTDTQMRSVSVTLTDLPDLKLYSSGTNLPEEGTTHEAIAMRGYETRKAVLTLTAGDWQIQLTDGGSDWENDAPPLYRVRLSNLDSSTFTLTDDPSDSSIVEALLKFFSFQSGRWIGIPTIVCAPADPEDWVVERAWVGQLQPRKPRSRSNWTAADWRKWPNLLDAFWKRYTDPQSRIHLDHAVFHYVRSSELFENDPIEALAATQSTLEALIRWWTGKSQNSRFSKGSFRDGLERASRNAHLGKDKGKKIDVAQMKRVIDKAWAYRNAIGHGLGGSVETEIQCVAACQMYYQNLARLLILAKLGDRDTDQRGNWVGPVFLSESENGSSPSSTSVAPSGP